MIGARGFDTELKIAPPPVAALVGNVSPAIIAEKDRSATGNLDTSTDLSRWRASRVDRAGCFFLEEQPARDEYHSLMGGLSPWCRTRMQSCGMPITLMVAIGKVALNVAGVGLVGDAAEIGKAAWNLGKRIPKRWLDGLPAFAQ